MPNHAQPTSSVRLTAGDAELTVLPDDGCRISSLRVGGTELLRTTPGRPHDYGSFPMVPWAGRTDHGTFLNGGVRHHLPIDAPPHAIHGTVAAAAWQRVEAASTDTVAAFTHDLAAPWPYAGKVTQVVELDPDGVSLTLGVETARESFPAQAGWHPWFLRHLDGNGGAAGDDGDDGEDSERDGVRVDFSPAWQEERGPDFMPTGTRIKPQPGPWDDCFGMPDGVDVTLTWPGRIELRITSPAVWVVVYTHEKDAVCVEPQSGPPNGLNIAPRLVTPIDPLEISTRWAWRRL